MQPPPRSPEDEARRERAALLRAWEGSTLTLANFCVLKRVDEATLQAQLTQARQEREAWRANQPALPPAHADRPQAQHHRDRDGRPAPQHAEARPAGARGAGGPGKPRDGRGRDAAPRAPAPPGKGHAGPRS